MSVLGKPVVHISPLSVMTAENYSRSALIMVEYQEIHSSSLPYKPCFHLYVKLMP